MTGIAGNRYILDEKIGSGGSGEIYRVQDRVLGVARAAKKTDAGNGGGEEGFLLSRLSHPGLPRVYDIVRDEEWTWTIYELLEGRNLLDLLKSRGRLEPQEILRIGIGLADVLGYIHRSGIIHGDVKPSNIIVDDREEVKLVDFGAAASVKPADGDRTRVMGTPGYASPEQQTAGVLSIRGDIYSFGITLIHLLTGEKPERPDLGPETEAPAAFRKIIRRCIAASPHDRFEDMKEVRQLLIALMPKHKPVGPASWPETNKYRPVLLKKMMISIPGHAEFACELAYCAARILPCKVLLADMDWLCQKVWIATGALPYRLEDGKCALAWTRILYPEPGDIEADPPQEIHELCRPSELADNLTILEIPVTERRSGLFQTSGLCRLMQRCQKAFDLVIISLPGYPAGSLMAGALLSADFILAAFGSRPEDLWEAIQFIRYCSRESGIGKERWSLVSLGGTAREWMQDILRISGLGLPIYDIPSSKSRDLARGKGIFYPKNKFQEIRGVYESLLKKIGVLNGG